MKILALSFAVGLLLAPFGHSQTAPIKRVDAAWEYEPVNVEFWTESQKFLTDKKYLEALEYALETERKFGPAKNEGAEALLIGAEAFIGLDLNVLAYENWLQVARTHPNSNAANQALLKISKFHAQNRYPFDQISRLVNEGRQREVPNEAQSMLGYFTALDNMKKNFREWVAPELKKIEPNTFWYRQLSFLNALDSVRAGQSQKAMDEMTILSQDPEIEAPLKRDVDWQLARLNLDTGAYDAAEKIYGGFLFSSRDFGRAMLERAWIRYFKKDYSTALGILYSMRAPYFDASRNAEQYLLSMLIYRDLCHYPAVQDVAKEFERVFEPSFKKMRSSSLNNIPELLSMVLVQANILPTADLVHSVRQQVARLKEGKFDPIRKNLAPYQRNLERKESELRVQLEYAVKDGLKVQANRLLEARDQVKLLDYVSGIEKLRIEKMPRRDYASAKDEPQKYETYYWNFKKEFWWDETANYRVLVQDRCGGGK